MISYIIRRIGLSVITLLGVITLIFLVVRLAPGDPVTVLLGDFYTEEAAAELTREFGLDRPLPVQYFTYLGNMLRGQFGKSYATGKPVMRQLLDAVPYTIHLAFGSMAFSLLVGIPTGIAAALNRNSWIDMISMTFASMFIAIPGFLVGLVLMRIFSLDLGILPLHGVGEPGNFASIVKHLILPSIALGSPTGAITARMTRSSILEVMNNDYVRTARAKGLSERVVNLKHVLRNAMVPILSMVGLSIVRRFGGSAVLEIIFNRRGIGSLLVNSIYDRDYMQVQLTVLFFAASLVFINLLIDIAYSFLDPRIRYD
ncbi:MAG: ABC transporter permease [Candidatus Acetothermia bacterium]